MVVAFALVACAGGSEEVSESEEIVLGHLTTHTGEWAGFGPHFDGAADFTLEIINEDPPLGRPIRAIHEDFGTTGEAQAVRKLLDTDGIDILLNAQHAYDSYRDYMLQYQEDNNAPLMPSVHAGAIPQEIGGDPGEPLFRGSPMDTAQSAAALLSAQEAGAQSIVIVASEISGFQLQKDGAIGGAEILGLEVLDVIDLQVAQTSYRSEASRIAGVEPDAIIAFITPEDGGTFVKNTAEAGISTIVIGTTDWQDEAFPATATLSALEQHEMVLTVGYTFADNDAWAYYEPLWNNSEYAEVSDAGNSYTIQYYDLLVVTALAIEAAGSIESDAWAAAVPEVTGAPGAECFTYPDCVVLIRDGEDIDYQGITGDYNYSDTGVVSGLFGSFQWVDLETLERVQVLDDTAILELDAAAASGS
jgi:ABC-type branched-subunit amino acid transport system substrate-binding protein